MQLDNNEEIYKNFRWYHCMVCRIQGIMPFDEKTLKIFEKNTLLMKTQISYYIKITNGENYLPPITLESMKPIVPYFRMLQHNPELPPMRIRCPY